MNIGDIILCPVYSIADTLKKMTGDGLFSELVENKGQFYFKYRIRDNDLQLPFEQLFMKFKFLCTGLSIATFGHFWVDDILLNEQGKPIWVRQKVIRLESDKEIDPNGPRPLVSKYYVLGQDVTGWIAKEYPRVFIYYTIGLFLLRSDLPTEYFYADVLLNFFKVVELVTYKRIKKQPTLSVIKAENKALDIQMLDDSEIQDFYIIRSRDSAHDFDKVKPVSRRQAVECKMWASELIIRDMLDRNKNKTRVALDIQETGNEAHIGVKLSRETKNQ